MDSIECYEAFDKAWTLHQLHTTHRAEVHCTDPNNHTTPVSQSAPHACCPWHQLRPCKTLWHSYNWIYINLFQHIMAIIMEDLAECLLNIQDSFSGTIEQLRTHSVTQCHTLTQMAKDLATKAATTSLEGSPRREGCLQWGILGSNEQQKGERGICLTPCEMLWSDSILVTVHHHSHIIL